jgi:hypothetical protein
VANARIPGPLREFDHLAKRPGPLGFNNNSLAYEARNAPGPVGTRNRRPTRVADGSKKDSKPAKQPAAPAVTPRVHLHLYLIITTSYSAENFYEWLRGPIDYDHPISRWEEAGIDLIFHSTKDSGGNDFKTSLLETGAVVVYLGHSVLDYKKKRSVGLTPKGLDKAEITPETLMSLLKKSKAGLVILATCASSTCVGKLTGGPAVVVTDSGDNLKTWSYDWAEALAAFLFVLLGYELDASRQPVPRKKGRGTISQALDASNEAFKNQKTTDRFVLANGDGSKVVFP